MNTLHSPAQSTTFNSYLKIFILLSAGVAMLGLSNCSSESISDINQERIYTSYSFSYDANDGTTTASARFTFGGATGTDLELDPPSSVTVNGLSMEEQNFLFLSHVREFNGVEPTATFLFTDSENNTYLNIIDLPAAIDTDITGSVDITNDYILTWTGDALGQQETIHVIFNSTDQFHSHSTNAVGATSITIPSSTLQSLGAGTHSIQITRTYDPALDQAPEAGGSIDSQYRSLHRSVTLSE